MELLKKIFNKLSNAIKEEQEEKLFWYQTESISVIENYLSTNLDNEENELVNVFLNSKKTDDFIEENFENFSKDFWDNISYRKLREEFIEKFHKKINFNNLSTIADKYNSVFLEKYSNKLNFNSINNNDKFFKKPLSLFFIEMNFDKLDKDKLIKFQQLPEWFIEKHLKHFNINDIIKYQENLSEKFLEKIFNKTDKELLLKYQQLSDSFIEKHYNNELDKVIKYQSVSEEFIRNHFNELNSKDIFENQQLSEELIYDLYDVGYLKELIIYQKLPEKFLNSILNNYETIHETNKENLVIFQELPEKFIEKHYKDINLDMALIFQKNLTEKFFKKHLKDFNEKNILDMIKHFKLSEQFIEKYLLKANNIKNNEALSKNIKKYLIEHQILSDEFIDRNNFSDIFETFIFDSANGDEVNVILDDDIRSNIKRKLFNVGPMNADMYIKKTNPEIVIISNKFKGTKEEAVKFIKETYQPKYKNEFINKLNELFLPDNDINEFLLKTKDTGVEINNLCLYEGVEKFDKEFLEKNINITLGYDKKTFKKIDFTILKNIIENTKIEDVFTDVYNNIYLQKNLEKNLDFKSNKEFLKEFEPTKKDLETLKTNIGKNNGYIYKLNDKIVIGMEGNSFIGNKKEAEKFIKNLKDSKEYQKVLNNLIDIKEKDIEI